MAKLTAKTKMVFEYIRDNDEGEGVSLPALAEGIGLTPKQIGPIIWTTLAKPSKDGTREALVSYEKVPSPEDAEKTVTIIHITEDGKTFTEGE